MLPFLPLTQTQETDNNEKKLVLSIIQSKVCIIYPRASEISFSAYIGNKPCAPPDASSTLLTPSSDNTRANDLYFKSVVNNLNDGNFIDY